MNSQAKGEIMPKQPGHDEKKQQPDAEHTITKPSPPGQDQTLSQAQNGQASAPFTADAKKPASQDQANASPPQQPAQGEQTLTAGAALREIAQSKHVVTFTKRGTISDPTLTHASRAAVPQFAEKVNWDIGDVIEGRFEVIEIIGQGGMGIVYRVNHREWKMEMAVKMPLAYLVADEASKARFIREAQTWVDLGLHPNIVQCWYVREIGGVPRVFMDYIEGGSLKDWIRLGKVKPGEWDKILDLVIQACDGLGYAHERGVEVHRDVKPGNMLLTNKGDLLVTDFGIVKRAGTEEAAPKKNKSTEAKPRTGQDITETGSELGTPEYGAPEQWGGAKNADRRADIYALGVILYELSCGRRPFDDGSHTEPVHVIIGRHLSMAAPSPKIFNPDIPDALAEIILRCLDKDPNKRPESMTDLRHELARIHREIIGKNYRRLIPQAADLRSDALNNRAVSFLDLNKEADAFSSWNEALKLDAYHPESLYNRTLLDWRACKLTDDDVIRQLEEAKHVTKRSSVYLGFIHLERAAADEAEQEFLSALEDQELRNNAPVWRALGDARLAQENYAGAEHAYQQVLDLVPRDKESLEHQRLAQARSRVRNEKVTFSWQHCCRAFESGHHGPVTSVAISSDGHYAVSGGEDKTIRLWNLITHECQWVFRGHEDAVLCVAITQDNHYVVSGSRDKTVRLWDVSSGKFVKSFRGHTDWVTVLKVAPDGRRAVSGSRDRTLRQWEIPTGKCFWTSEKFSNEINTLAITPDGRFALSGHEEENLYLWDLTTGKRTERKYYGASLETLGLFSTVVSALTIAPDGSFAVAGHRNASMQLWDVKSGQELQRLKGGHDEAITSIAVTGDNRHIISASTDATLCLWDLQLEKNAHVWTFEGHREAITGIDISKETQTVISGSRDATVKLWNPTTRENFWTFWEDHGHTDVVTAVEFGLNGRFLVSASLDMSLRLWDVESAKCLRTYEGHVKEVTCLAVTPDGRMAVSGGKDEVVLLWELGTARCFLTFKGHEGNVTAVTMTPDGQFLVSGGEDRTVRLWSLKTGKLLRTLSGHAGSITSLSITPDGRFVVSGSHDRTLRLWNLSTGNSVRVFAGHNERINSVYVLSDARFALSGSHDNTIRLWHLGTGKCARIFSGHKDGVNGVVATVDRRYLISGADDHTVRLWELATAKCLRTFKGHKDSVTSVAITPDGRYAASGSRDASLKLWDLDVSNAERYDAALQVSRQQNHGELQILTERFQKLMEWAKTAWEHGKTTAAYRYLLQARSTPGYERAPETLALSAIIGKVLPRKRLRGEWEVWVAKEHHGTVTGIAVTPDGHIAVSSSADMTLRAWEIETGKFLQLFDGHWLAVNAVAITPDNRFVASGSEDTALRLWDIRSGRCLRTYEGHQQDVSAVTVSPDGRHLLSGSADGTIRVWNPASTKCLQIIKGHRDRVSAVGMTADRRYLFSGGEDRSVRLWDKANGKMLQLFKGHKQRVNAVIATPDSHYLISASSDGTLRLWNIETNKCVLVLKGHEGEVLSVTMTPDGRFLFSGGDDKTVRLWDLVSGQNIWTFRGHKKSVTAISITPDGRFLLSGSEDQTLRAYELDWELDTSEQAVTLGDDHEKVVQSTGVFQRLTALFQTGKHA
ncbi:serine/threonine protein kinase with WD40 repeats [Candidatus Moduliflexus flocculans]|uniref:Serine/threonine protein kinase with WD40 repeats n=1 Tax=Candidatus Moduliflexus flocculans TaxID=1499966 RepID=A0A0S6VVT2_9BACT|nr:serine/threonine protein kinase with WD40 repeats [Candidatus Moduliflexus flocculans]